jgi:hypothetical protein
LKWLVGSTSALSQPLLRTKLLCLLVMNAESGANVKAPYLLVVLKAGSNKAAFDASAEDAFNMKHRQSAAGNFTISQPHYTHPTSNGLTTLTKTPRQC